VAFTPDGAHCTFLWSERGDLTRDLWAVDCATGARRVLAAASAAGPTSLADELRRERLRLRETGITDYAWAAAAPALLLCRGDEAWVDGACAARQATAPQLTADGRTLAFVRDGEVWARDLPAGAERRLTHGAEPGLTHGLPDYLAQEEMDRHAGFWLSRDGRFCAFEEADERHIPDFPIVHQAAESPRIEHHRYPFAGGANPRVRLGVVPLAGGPVRWLDLGDAEYLARVAFGADGRLWVQTQDRRQRRLALDAFDPATGARAPILVEEAAPWVNLHHDLRVLDDGTFVWSSERSGTRQLYRYRGGTCLGALTPGPWPVDCVVAVAGGHVFYEGGIEDPGQRHGFAVPLAGGAPARWTPEPGWHGGARGGPGSAVARDGGLIADAFESAARPPALVLRTPDGTVRHVVHAAATPPALPAPERFRFRTRDGVELAAAYYRPAATPAPLLVHVYGGPHVQLVHDTWAATVDLRDQWLAQQGFGVLKVDGRGSARRGVAFETAIAGRLGDVEVRDQVDGVAAARARGLVAGDRVGIVGWSYGGYLAVMCCARAPEVFRAGVVGAPVTDWLGYDTHYTERYLGLPSENAEGYRQSAVWPWLDALRAPLLLIHGMLDENVHFRHTARLVEALQQRGAPFELMLLPAARHMPRDPAGLAALETRVADFFRRSL
jgi:dipeptidyl-peptidase-4